MFLNSFDQLADFIGITLTMMLGMSMRGHRKRKVVLFQNKNE
jgi:hypothetical protein